MRSIETPLGPQTFTDGLAVFYRVKNEAGKGDRPKYTMEEFLRVPFRKWSGFRASQAFSPPETS